MPNSIPSPRTSVRSSTSKSSASAPKNNKTNVAVRRTSSDETLEPYVARRPTGSSAGSVQVVPEGHHALRRDLKNRQIQLITMGGAVGTALFVSIGSGLAKGGPLSLLISWTLYAINLALINNGLAEMMTLYPVEGGFVRLAEHFVDPALGFMAGINFVSRVELCSEVVEYDMLTAMS